MALKKVETCIIDATKLLEAADDVDKMMSDYLVEQEFGSIDKAEEMQSERLLKTKDIVRSRICVAQEDCPIISLLEKKEVDIKKARLNYHEAHDLITRAALEELVKCAGVDKEKLDAALKEMEGYRKRSSQNPVEYPVDYAIRLCEATVAELAGYPDRASWHHLQFFP